MANLSTMIQLLSTPANGFLTLEGQNTTCADVFYVWVAIAWHVEKTLSNPATSAGSHRDEVIKIYNNRFSQTRCACASLRHQGERKSFGHICRTIFYLISILSTCNIKRAGIVMLEFWIQKKMKPSCLNIIEVY
jgi:hypothetical protein